MEGFIIHQIDVAAQLCKSSWFTPIQNFIYDYGIILSFNIYTIAKQLMNLIYVIEDVTSKECLVIDAVTLNQCNFYHQVLGYRWDY